MPSLTQLLAGHRFLLVLDAATTSVQIGLLGANRQPVWHRTDLEACAGIFDGTQSLCTQAGINLSEIGAMSYCEGPGSMLGIRTVTMALSTWQVLAPRAIYAYRSLAVAGHYEWKAQAPRAFTLIADARRDTWHSQSLDAEGRLAAPQRLRTEELPDGDLLVPAGFRIWSTLPRPVSPCTYDLELMLPAIADADHFRRVTSPESAPADAPAFRKWSAQVHSAATADKK